jgi:hypothetical protein
LLGKLGAFTMGIPQRALQLGAATAIEFSPHSFRDELAAIFLPPVDVFDQFAGQSHSHTLYS